MDGSELRDKLAGTLLGTALGDALGFIAERMPAEIISRRFGKIKRFYVIGRKGFVTDDTEQSALIAYSIATNPGDIDGCVRTFRRSLLLWFLCLPFGIGRATVQACLRLAAGLKESGVKSAGNGSAMRASIVGVYFHEDPESRRLYGTQLGMVTHTDQRAVEGALFVAELAAKCAGRPQGKPLPECCAEAIELVKATDLRKALENAADLAESKAATDVAAAALNHEPCAFIVNSLAFSLFCFLRYGEGDVLTCLAETVGGGGDADTNGAIVGGWLGALHGESRLPAELLCNIDDGPFGPTHLRKLADCLVQSKTGRKPRAPFYSLPHCIIRNAVLVPIILFHASLRLLPARR